MDIDDTIRTHGVYLQGVTTEHPYDVPFVYTIGRHLRGEPELIAFSRTIDVPAVLNELARDRPPQAVHAGARLPVDALDGDEVELRHARPEWAADHGLLAFDHAGKPPWELPFLQVVLPDKLGRLPGEDGRPATCPCCPDLALLDRPWAHPLDTDAVFGLGLSYPPLRPTDAIEVCVPVRYDGEDVHRLERLVARDRADGTVTLLQPPVIADWTTAGAVLRLDDKPDPCGEPVATTEVTPSPAVHLAWAWSLHPDDVDVSGRRRLQRAIDRIAALPGVMVTVDLLWFAVAALPRSSHQVRSTMRRLVRDGLAREADPFSRPSQLCSDASCACCGSPL